MIITLNNEIFSASIDSLGAQLISLKDRAGKEYIWQRDPAFWKNCSPLLFPIVGNCRGGKTRIEGAWYEIPKHGFCKETDFEVTDQSETSARFSITSTGKTREVYPYEFRLSLTYTLTDDGLFMDYAVENLEERTIYYCLGAHPGFVTPLEDGEKFSDYQLEFEKEEHADSIVYDLANLQFDVNNRLPLLQGTNILPLEYRLFDNDAIFFPEIASRKVSIVHPGTRKGIEVDYRDFETVAFWTPDHKESPFLCVEPWNGSAICSDEDDEFTHKNHVQSLKAGEVGKYHLGIRIL